MTCKRCKQLLHDLERGRYLYIAYPLTGKAQLVYHPGVLDAVPMADPCPVDELAPMTWRDHGIAGESEV
jgi:hypothetical protein